MTTKPKLLLHSCCGPCSTAVIERLILDYDVTVFYYNPNIFPREEYIKRLEEQRRLLNILNIPFIEGNYIPEEYFDCIGNKISEREGQSRCYECYKLRIAKTFELAQKLGFEVYTTTLTVSPRKNATWVNEIGQRLQNPNVKFLVSDFKKKDGYKRSIELSKQYNLYRQHYCGCEASIPTSADVLE